MQPQLHFKTIESYHWNRQPCMHTYWFSRACCFLLPFLASFGHAYLFSYSSSSSSSFSPRLKNGHFLTANRIFLSWYWPHALNDSSPIPDNVASRTEYPVNKEEREKKFNIHRYIVVDSSEKVPLFADICPFGSVIMMQLYIGTLHIFLFSKQKNMLWYWGTRSYGHYAIACSNGSRS